MVNQRFGAPFYLAGDAGAAVANASGAVDSSASNVVPGEVSMPSVVTADLLVDRATEIVFVDSAVADLTSVADPVANGAQIVVLNGDSNGVQQIQQHLAGRSGIKAIHVVSHGSNGQLQLGATKLNHDSLGANAEALRGWADAIDWRR